tara:strand:- start:1791 stop:2267 length:477 start_codon:yes stop_codon:yes gene_type:complete
MTTVTEAILAQYSNVTDMYIRTNNLDRFAGSDGWKPTDTLKFMRQMKLQQEIRFCEYWLPRAQKRLDTQRGWVTHWLRARNGDEISENNYQSSKAQAAAEQHTVILLTAQLEEAQAAYKKDNGDGYSTTPDGNVIEDGTPQEISDEEKAELKALGITI